MTPEQTMDEDTDPQSFSDAAPQKLSWMDKIVASTMKSMMKSMPEQKGVCERCGKHDNFRIGANGIKFIDNDTGREGVMHTNCAMEILVLWVKKMRWGDNSRDWNGDVLR